MRANQSAFQALIALHRGKGGGRSRCSSIGGHAARKGTSHLC